MNKRKFISMANNIQMFAEPVSGTTKLENLIDPEVMAPMISAKLEKAIVETPFVKVDTTLQGQPGSTITVPKYEYIGDAEDVAEGVAVGTTKLQTSTAQYTIKKVMKAVNLTDEAVLSGYGNPVGEANNQLATSVKAKINNDIIDELLKAKLIYTSENIISYDETVKAIDLFNEEINTEKLQYVHPKQVTQLRLDPTFISADKYNNNVVMKGEIGMIANTRIVPSRKVVENNGYFLCPIVQLNYEEMTQDDTPAVTVYLKRDINIEKERHTLERTTDISVDKHYVAALTDESKVVIAKYKVTAPTTETESKTTTPSSK